MLCYVRSHRVIYPEPHLQSAADKNFVISGFNTDIEHDGVTYHVQTEDKGLKTPFILSLVYKGGTILASKRSPYDDIVETGFDEAELESRVNRQHKLICAAIHAGRIDDLMRNVDEGGFGTAGRARCPKRGSYGRSPG